MEIGVTSQFDVPFNSDSVLHSFSLYQVSDQLLFSELVKMDLFIDNDPNENENRADVQPERNSKSDSNWVNYENSKDTQGLAN